MISTVKRYMNWLHLQWPAGLVEKLPLSGENGSTNLPGVYIAGDLRGVPLLKFSADFGARAVKSIVEDPGFQSERTASNTSGDSGMLDLAILGGGIAGMAAGLEARKAGLRFEILEANEAFSTIINFPKGKPIYTYPNEMVPTGDLRFSAEIKELLIEELIEQTIKTGLVPLKARVLFLRRRGTHIEVQIENGKPVNALRVIIALGRSGDYREMGISGERLDKVYNRLHDPQDYCSKSALVVGGGDSALETAVALGMCGAHVTLSYRKKEFSRPKAENIQKTYALARPPENRAKISSSSRPGNGYIKPPSTPGSLRLELGSHVKEIRDKEVLIQTAGNETKTIDNDVVFTMLGREAPLEFFRRSAIRIAGEWTAGRIAAFAAFFLFCVALYNWKSGGFLSTVSYHHGWFPFSLVKTFSSAAADPKTFMGTLVISASGPAFWYTLAYSIIVALFGIRRISRRKTPYITFQTLTLVCIQVIPLFILPEVILPLLGHNGLIPGWLSHALFSGGELRTRL